MVKKTHNFPFNKAYKNNVCVLVTRLYIENDNNLQFLLFLFNMFIFLLQAKKTYFQAKNK